MARGQRTSEGRRREVVAAFRRSGLSLKRFAATVGVPYSTLANWRQEADRVAGPRLVPVTVEAAPADVTLEVAVGPATVRVPAGFDEGHLVRVVRALRAC